MPPDWGTSLYRIVVTVAVVFLISCLAAFVVCRWVPWSDPPDVVGIPLLTGYTERGEQMAYYTFFVVSLVLGWLVHRYSTSVPEAIVIKAGCLLLPVLLLLPSCLDDPALIPLVLLGAYPAFLTGAIASRWNALAPPPAAIPWATALLVWVLWFPEPFLWISPGALSLAGFLVLLCGLCAWGIQRLGDTAKHRLRHAADWLVLLLIAAELPTALPHEISLELCGVLFFFLGCTAGTNGDVRAAVRRVQWFVFVVVLSAVMGVTIRNQGWYDPTVRLLVGAGAAAVLLRLLIAHTGKNASELMAGLNRIPPKIPLAGCFTALALLTIRQPYFGGLIGITAVLSYWISTRRRTKWAAGFVLALLLGVAFLPGARIQKDVDHFHDGQALSGVREFEQGRTLYSEVLPLRSFQFYVGWASRKVLPSTVEAYRHTLHLLQFLSVSGACLAAYAWSRSLLWSLACGLLVGTCFELDARQGCQIVLLATGMEIVRATGRYCWCGLVIPGVLSALAGYDMLVAFTAASGAAILMAPRPCKADVSMKRHLVEGVLCGTAVMAAIALTFSILLWLWQGQASVVAYWSLFVDYSRHYNAFYGLPFMWTDSYERFHVATCLLILCAWCVAGCRAWPRICASRRRMLVFLVVGYFFILHRGLGRTDGFHLRDATYASLILGSLGLYETIRLLRRSGHRTSWLNTQGFALGLIVISVWLTRHGSPGPHVVAAGIRALPMNETPDIGPNDYVQRMVAPDESLWGVEDSMINYANQRRNPTRHALALTIGSPAEQRAVVAALQQDPPQLIVWPTSLKVQELMDTHDLQSTSVTDQFLPGLPTAEVMVGVDSVATPLRYYIISRFLFLHYHPVDQQGFLEPAPADWPGVVDLPRHLNGTLRLGMLPFQWGQHRVLPASESSAAVQPLVGWKPQADGPLDDESPRWTTTARVDSRHMNYLYLRFACRSVRDSPVESLRLSLAFSPVSARDQYSRLTFEAMADAQPHSYLIPIGCSPGWSWRPEIREFELAAPAGTVLSQPVSDCRVIDDMIPAVWQ